MSDPLQETVSAGRPVPARVRVGPYPAGGAPVGGRITPPPSKSAAHRALLCAAAGRPLQDLMTFPQRYCGVSTLRLTPGGLAVERVDELLWR